MATDINIGYDITVAASVDLSTKQYRFVTAAGAVAGAGAQALGVLQNDPKSGQGAGVRVMGVSKLVLGGTVSVDTKISSDANGAGVAFTAAAVNTSDAGASADPVNTGSHVMAIALRAGVSGDTIDVALVHAGLSN